MKQIYLIATGGTIACLQRKQDLAPTQTGQALLDALPGCLPDCKVTVCDLMCVDSTDMTEAQRMDIVREIWNNRGKYDGFVVTHGTDTLAYTAAILYRALEYFDKPVIVTGSMQPLGMPDSEAERNLCGALTAACSDYHGAAVLCGRWLLRGCDAVKFYSVGSNAFASVSGTPDGSWEDGKLTIHHRPAVGYSRLRLPKPLRTAVVDIVPGFSAEVIVACCNLDVLILRGYGMGGVSSELVKAVEAVVNSGTRVLVSTQCAVGGANTTVYAVGKRIEHVGTVCMGTQSVEDALACIACGVTGKDTGCS